MNARRRARAALAAIVVGIVAAAAGFLLDPRGMLRSWLFAWLFALGIALGSLANLMVHTLTHGRWGEPIRPPMIAAVRILPFLALLAIPILVGAHLIFPWAAGADHERPESWLNVPFFDVRALAYLVAWNAVAWWWLRADRSSVDPSSSASPAAVRASCVGLLVYALTVTLAAFDWIASLTPDWFSSGLGLLLGVSQMLAGAAFAVAAAAIAAAAPGDAALEQRFHDLGNLVLMYVLTWAYLAFAQFLIIWSENLPHEIRWYVPRLQTSWVLLAVFLVAFQFFLPLLLLLMRAAKRSVATLGAICGALLVVHCAYVFWLVLPGFRPRGFAIAWTDPAALAGVAAVCALAWPAAWHAALARTRPVALRQGAAHG